MKLDTRTKIVTEQQAAALTNGKRVKTITGHFDPLLAEHARVLRQAASPGELLVVVITNAESPLLPQRVRAELVAALADVDYVVMKDGPPMAEEDSRISAEFVELVLSRRPGAV